MRTITLLNGYGETLNVTTTEYFMHSLNGFGFERENSYRRIGSRFLCVNSRAAQSSISVNVCFAGASPYDQYFKMVQFCKKLPLKMIYTAAAHPYSKDVVLAKVEKTEINKYGVLNVAMTFEGLTPWYREVSLYTPSEINEENSRFDYTFPISFADNEPMSVVINSDSFEESPTKLYIYGPVKNPGWTIFQNGTVAGRGKINNVEVAEGSVLVIDCTKDPYEIGIYGTTGELTRDVYQYSDFATERFVWLGPGVNQITVTSDLVDKVPIKLEAKLYYDTV